MFCLNCNLALLRSKRHVVTSLPVLLQDTLVRWMNMQELPPDGLICRECYDSLITNPEIIPITGRQFGHSMVCVGCHRSVKQKRYKTFAPDSPLLSMISQSISKKGASGNNLYYACHACYTKATQRLQRANNVQNDQTLPCEPKQEVQHEFPYQLLQCEPKQEVHESPDRILHLEVKQEIHETADHLLHQELKQEIHETADQLLHQELKQEIHETADQLLHHEEEIDEPSHLMASEHNSDFMSNNVCNSMLRNQRDQVDFVSEHNDSDYNNPDTDDPEYVYPYKKSTNSTPVNKTKATITLPNYKRAANTANRCVFYACKSNKSLRNPPIMIRGKLLKKHNFYIPSSCRVCKHHIYSDKWDTLIRDCNYTNKFTAQHIEDALAISNRHTEVIDFEKVTSMPDHLCKYWTGCTILEFVKLVEELYGILKMRKARTALAIYLTKLKTCDTDQRLSLLFGIPRSTLRGYAKKVKDCLNEHNITI